MGLDKAGKVTHLWSNPDDGARKDLRTLAQGLMPTPPVSSSEVPNKEKMRYMVAGIRKTDIKATKKMKKFALFPRASSMIINPLETYNESPIEGEDDRGKW